MSFRRWKKTQRFKFQVLSVPVFFWLNHFNPQINFTLLWGRKGSLSFQKVGSLTVPMPTPDFLLLYNKEFGWLVSLVHGR